MSSPRKFLVVQNWVTVPDFKKIRKLLKSRPLDFNTEFVCGSSVMYRARKFLSETVERAVPNCSLETERNTHHGPCLKTIKCYEVQWVILGLPRDNYPLLEEYCKESDSLIAEKASLALQAGLKVIYCVGENQTQRLAGETFTVVFNQLQALVDRVPFPSDWGCIVIAYNPYWARETLDPATPQQIQEIHSGIRQWLWEFISLDVAKKTRIIFSGHVTDENYLGLRTASDVDGFLLDLNGFTFPIKQIQQGCLYNQLIIRITHKLCYKRGEQDVLVISGNDADGMNLECTLWDEAALNYDNMLEAGQLYKISHVYAVKRRRSNLFESKKPNSVKFRFAGPVKKLNRYSDDIDPRMCSLDYPLFL